MRHKIILIVFISIIMSGCGKIGPLNLPEEKLDKSVITYPCTEKCMKKLEDEKLRQQSVVIQTN